MLGTSEGSFYLLSKLWKKSPQKRDFLNMDMSIFLYKVELSTINWNRDATGAFEEEPTKGHGRIDCRRIQTMTPLPGTVNFPHIAQIFRIERDREIRKSGKKSTEIAYGITSVPKDRGTPEKLLAWNRGHWSIENNNHRVRRQLQRGCLPQPHDARPQQRCNLQLHRARDHPQPRSQNR